MAVGAAVSVHAHSDDPFVGAMSVVGAAASTAVSVRARSDPFAIAGAMHVLGAAAGATVSLVI